MCVCFPPCELLSASFDSTASLVCHGEALQKLQDRCVAEKIAGVSLREERRGPKPAFKTFPQDGPIQRRSDQWLFASALTGCRLLEALTQ